jgi:hypothetical protein
MTRSFEWWFWRFFKIKFVRLNRPEYCDVWKCILRLEFRDRLPQIYSPRWLKDGSTYSSTLHYHQVTIKFTGLSLLPSQDGFHWCLAKINIPSISKLCEVVCEVVRKEALPPSSRNDPYTLIYCLIPATIYALRERFKIDRMNEANSEALILKYPDPDLFLDYMKVASMNVDHTLSCQL